MVHSKIMLYLLQDGCKYTNNQIGHKCLRPPRPEMEAPPLLRSVGGAVLAACHDACTWAAVSDAGAPNGSFWKSGSFLCASLSSSLAIWGVHISAP